MMHKVPLFFISAVLAGVPAFAGSRSIGIATALASYSVGNQTVSGPTEITPGATLSTTISPSEVRLQNGADVVLATHSSGTLFDDRIALTNGALRVGHFDQYPVAVGDLQVQADSGTSQAIIRLNGPTVEIAALGGGIQVSDGGARMIRIASGTHMAFDTQTGAQTGTQTGAQTGASRGHGHPGLDEGDRNALLWSIAVIGGSAIVIGSIAAAEGKNPF